MNPDWVDVFPIKYGDIPACYVSLPEGTPILTPGWCVFLGKLRLSLCPMPRAPDHCGLFRCLGHWQLRLWPCLGICLGIFGKKNCCGGKAHLGDLKELFHGKKTENMVKKRKNGGKMKYMVKKIENTLGWVYVLHLCWGECFSIKVRKFGSFDEDITF